MLLRIFPFLGWFKGYNMAAFRADAIAGLTVALVLIPQSMAYAQLAGMPPYYGLYASFLPPLVAALFGSSRQLATGPVAVVSLMTSASLAPLATAGSEGYIAYAILLALLVGIFQFALGVLRLGLVVNFLSHPVVNGFTNAGALIIATSQLSKMFGVSVDAADHYYETIMRVVAAAVHHTHWPTLIMGAAAFAIMFGLKKLNPRIPNVLVAVVITTLVSWGIGFEHNAKVDIASIKSAQVVADIEAFNKAAAELPAIAAKRAAMTPREDAAKASGDATEAINIAHELALLDLQKTVAKEDSSLYRTKLRQYLLTAVPGEGGKLAFYLQGEAPAGAATDGRTWIMRVGNSPLKTDTLPMIGGGQVVGVVPSGLPGISIPKFDLKVMLKLFPYAAIIALLGFMEAISIAKAMAAKTGQRLDPNQELIGQGLANMLGSAAQSYPASGSFSRSAVNLQAGAVTGFSSVFTSATVVITLFFFTPLLYNLPQSVLAAVIMMAVIGLLNASGFIHAWKAQWYDGAISIITFLATLVFAPHLDKGIMIGVVLSLLVFLYKSMRPRVASLSLTEDSAYRDASVFKLAECPYVAVVRFDGTLFFANASFLEDQITERMQSNKNLKHIILATDGVNDMDASGEEALSLLVDRIRSAGLDISLCGVKESVMDVMKRTHLLEHIGEDHLYPDLNQALCSVHKDSWHAPGESCPLTSVCRLPGA
ncbi:sulfate transporter [Solidesulfovibrio fructosivorans JJ]]|uniref:Sulfate transporter n=1 Tax=Solidesulfovibrio fructosivorans JJ] TaxID=596151 RepID=E1JS81_SOLFR|nr:SulP family inorganic anion transporter [Solidesulfovibrio fructosivorans]EFL52850.1 sulfate transporter [Solidesulfovibrio fructosivorans JJ]]